MLDNNLIEVENFLPDDLVNSLVEFSQGDVPWETKESQKQLSRREINFILDKMFINVTILHPIKKRELSCHGKVNDYELK